MKSKTLQHIACAVITALALCSCQKEPGRFRTGDEVRFTAGSGSAGTKAAYSGQTNTAGTIERIDWEVNDLLRIYCAQASEPSVHYADYKVTSVESLISGREELSRAHIEVSSPATDGIGLRWGTGSHTFYAAFPSPATTGGITTGITGKNVSANLPAVQSIVGDITRTGSAWVAEPDLSNMLMTAKTTCTEATMPDENTVFLNFTPLTTAVQFTIKNDTGAQMDLTSVQLISGNGKSTAEPVINGAFSVDLDQTGIASGTMVTPYSGLNITYNRAYPLCTGTATTSTDMSDRTVTINVGTATAPLSLAVNETLTFTFFLNPIHDFNDLTFKLVKSDSSWMSTRLGYTDGTGIFFPRHKKSFVTGILVPEGAQWTVKYTPTVVSWNADSDTAIDPMPEVSIDPFVTSWDTGVEDDLELTDPYNGHEYVEIGNIKWATCNIGADSPTEYGWYFSWAGTTGYVRSGTKWVTEQGGSELSGGFSWANAQYNTGGVNTSWNKYIPTGKTGYWTGGGSPDNKLSLELVDDAARANWGGSWRMPTQADFQTLYEACGGTGISSNPPALPSANPGKGIYWVSNSQTYISDYNGVAGILFCDGVNKLFFVAAGYGVDGNFNDEGFCGRYWSGSVFSNPPYNAYYMSFVSNNVKPDDANGRNQGFPVRPVSY